LRQKAQAAQFIGLTGWSLILSSLSAGWLRSRDYGAKPGFAHASDGA
jgi:hypothetical protein